MRLGGVGTTSAHRPPVDSATMTTSYPDYAVLSGAARKATGFAQRTVLSTGWDSCGGSRKRVYRRGNASAQGRSAANERPRGSGSLRRGSARRRTPGRLGHCPSQARRSRVSERLPVVFGAQLIEVLQKLDWEVTRQRGSHVRLKHQDRAMRKGPKRTPRFAGPGAPYVSRTVVGLRTLRTYTARH